MEGQLQFDSIAWLARSAAGTHPEPNQMRIQSRNLSVHHISWCMDSMLVVVVVLVGWRC